MVTLLYIAWPPRLSLEIWSETSDPINLAFCNAYKTSIMQIVPMSAANLSSSCFLLDGDYSVLCVPGWLNMGNFPGRPWEDLS
jgi:hypothetical protein